MVAHEVVGVSVNATTNFDRRGTSAVPAKEDWEFRLDVISSTKEVDDSVFEKAVQGLCQICFPEGVLDELGVNIIVEHMRQKHASQESINRMRTVFESAIIQQIAQMLALYTDSTLKA